MTEGAMDKVRLGRTDLMVTSVCFGTSGLGDMPDTYGYGVDEARARATLHAIFDGPANFIDTSRNYGSGRSEERIGAAIRERGGLPARLRHLDQARPRFRDERVRRLARASLARAKPEDARDRSGRSPAPARSRARPLVRRGDGRRRRARRTLPHQGGGVGEGGGARGRPGFHDDAALARTGISTR